MRIMLLSVEFYVQEYFCFTLKQTDDSAIRIRNMHVLNIFHHQASLMGDQGLDFLPWMITIVFCVLKMK